MCARGPRPTWIADGLGPYNPSLDVRSSLPEMMAGYTLAAESPGYRIYRIAPGRQARTGAE